jgi:hypothetical protein
MKRKTFWVAEEDEQALTVLRERYGCESDSQALRLALRVLAQAQRLDVVLPERPKHARRSQGE